MVSTRQSSSGGGGGDSSGSGSEAGPSKTIRNSPQVVRYCSSNDPDTGVVAVPTESSHLLALPQEVCEKILGYMSYRNIAELRLVCRQLDRVCGAILNSTFQRLQAQMLQRFQNIKGKMPRRESARRNHPLACESDIIETLHMRLTLLQMTFGKHIERKHCCFFAGEILDEVYRILHYIKVTPKLGRPYKVTDELFDLSTMAMEYFKEHIEPTLPEIAYFGTDFLDFTGTFASSSNKSYMCLDSPTHSNSKGDESPSGAANEVDDHLPDPLPPSNMVLRKRICRIRRGMKRYNTQLIALRRELRNCKGKVTEQHKQILEYSNRLDDYDKKFEENSRKFSTLLQELNKCKTELQYWRSKSPANPLLCFNCGKVLPPNEDPLREADLQALMNQGVLVGEPGEGEVERLAGELDFIPIASTSREDWEVSKTVNLPEWDSGPGSEKEDEEVVVKTGVKRKGDEAGKDSQEVKKTRRVKGRKRVKI